MKPYKIKKALELRQRDYETVKSESKPGFKVPGSLNRKRCVQAKHTARTRS
jgi:hypothetical protein